MIGLVRSLGQNLLLLIEEFIEMKNIYRAIVCLVSILNLYFCSSAPKKQEVFSKISEEQVGFFEEPRKIALKVSKTHKDKLHAIQTQEYTTIEAEEVFTKLRKDSTDICKIYYKYIEYNEARVNDFSNGLRFNRGKKEKWFDNLNSPLMAGCFNFFKMNDRSINNTFSKVKKIVDGETDCFSVGFLQPYLLHTIVGCQELTMIDMDWRIIYTHLKLVQKFEEEKFANISLDTQDKVLSDLPVAWVARFDRKPLEDEKNIGLKTFCANSEMSYCKEIFINFQNHFKNINAIQLQLSHLHEVSIRPRAKNTIIFTSNALDKEYTTKKELEYFLNSMFSNLVPEKNIFIIYQVGGMKEFGVYKLSVDSKGNRKVETVCRDEYRLSEEYVRKNKKYYINMDKMSSTKYPPKCQ